MLSEVKKKEIITDESLPINILIEGDNYHALSVLNYTHKGKIDLIYIDPPYNTGAKDFVYNDKYVEKNDTWRHSKWINFMSKRLELSRNLLKNEGVIFISINEEEQAQLKLLCDEIFGADNYLTMFSIKVRHEGRILKGDKDFHEVIEYLFLYRKSNSFKTIKRVLDNTSIDEYVYEIEELIDNPKTINFGKKEIKVFEPNQYRKKKGDPGLHKVKKTNIRGSIKEGNSSGRFFMKYLADKLGKELGCLYKVPDIGDDGIGFRYFLLPENPSRTNGDYFQGIPLYKSNEKEIPYANFMDFEYDFNNVGYEGGIEFRNGKKPVNFILKCFEIGGVYKNKNAIVLDYFAGSGTTGHAVLTLNNEDKGNRQFILCNNNENQIAESVTYPRIKSAIKGYKISESENVKGLGGNLRYFKTSFVSNSRNKDQLKIDITKKCTEMLCLKEGIYNVLKDHTENDEPVWKIFKQNNRYMAVYYDFAGKPLESLKKEMNKITGDKVLYCFTTNTHGLDKHNFSDWENIRLEPIPQKILDVYKRIFKGNDK
ncbi:MAG: site-specific DNA-methyltransferase [Exilispira sp.]|nr:site-specific DNA-methyltransferase [Exilispira sp.]